MDDESQLDQPQTIWCPNCQQDFEVDPVIVGTRFVCTKCGHAFNTESREPGEAALPIGNMAIKEQAAKTESLSDTINFLAKILLYLAAIALCLCPFARQLEMGYIPAIVATVAFVLAISLKVFVQLVYIRASLQRIHSELERR